jgi:dienelactone hydrolase
VLATEYPSDLCRWLDEAVVLVRAGFRVLLFDFRGLGLSPVVREAAGGDYAADVVAAVDQLRRLGATSVQVVGASLGGNATLVAAPRLGRRVAGVASLSGELDLSSLGRNLNALAAVRRMSVPLLVMTSADDRYLDGADARRLFAAARSRQKTLRIYPGTAHGWDLVYTSPYRRRAQSALLAFLRRNARQR